MLEDMLSDLGNFSVIEVERACMRYRMNGENRFFPTSGQLMAEPKEKPVVPHSNLKRLAPDEFVNPHAARKLKSVAQVLREHGYDAAAGKWEARNHLAKTGATG